MGLLVEGVALSPEETAKVGAFIREHGITQFLNTWRRVKDIHDDELRFGDEIECGIFVINGLEKTVKLSIRGAEVRLIFTIIKIVSTELFDRFERFLARRKLKISTKLKVALGIQRF